MKALPEHVGSVYFYTIQAKFKINLMLFYYAKIKAIPWNWIIKHFWKIFIVTPLKLKWEGTLIHEDNIKKYDNIIYFGTPSPNMII